MSGCYHKKHEPFVANGMYSITNTMGFEVQIDDCGEMGRTRETYMNGKKKVSKWKEIKPVRDEETGEVEMVISGGADGLDIPLNQVERVPSYWDARAGKIKERRR